MIKILQSLKKKQKFIKVNAKNWSKRERARLLRNDKFQSSGWARW